jgi:hypothetical protein
LWTNVFEPPHWTWTPHQPGHEQEVQPLTAKLFGGPWAMIGARNRNPMTITGKRLDGSAPPLMVMTWQRPDGSAAQATNAIMGSSAAILTGVYVPTPGCWEITADYRGDKLSFVVWLEPAKQ